MPTAKTKILDFLREKCSNQEAVEAINRLVSRVENADGLLLKRHDCYVIVAGYQIFADGSYQKVA